MLLLSAIASLMCLAVRGAVVHDAPQGACVVTGALRRTPYAGDTEFATAAFLIVVRTINPPPSVAATNFDAPTLPFGVLERVLYLFLCVRGTGVISLQYGSVSMSCQLTTYHPFETAALNTGTATFSGISFGT